MKYTFQLLLLCSTISAFASTVGVSTHPIKKGKHFVHAGVTGFLGGSETIYDYGRLIKKEGTGFGVVARYVYRFHEKMIVDAGIGVAGGAHKDRFFVGLDYLIFPDYAKQPRVSTKVSLASSNEFKSRRTILGLAPTVSKGFTFWKKEAYPFISLPLELSLNSKTEKYKTVARVHFGATANVPIEGYEKWVATLEGNIGLKDSYSGFLVGLAYPFK